MKLQAQINDETHEVEITKENGSLFASVDGRQYELESSEPEPGVYLFKHEGRVYQATVSSPNKAGGSTHVRVGSSEFDIRLVDPKRLRGVGAGNDHEDGIAEIKTAMPGKVVRVLVEPGAQVEAGDGVIVVEAMKMQNELKAPKSGTIKEVRVIEGAAVSSGDILVTVE
jgi:biotin carboxyl carrier protein